MTIINSKQLKYEEALKYEIFVKGEYDFAKEKIKEAKCVFDIWWHIWLFSQWCRLLNENVKIYYFEPVEDFYNRAKIVLWNDKNIILNNLWIGAKSGSWIILQNQEKTMQSSKYSSFLNPRWNKIVVNFITLKKYLKLINLDRIDVLKMDIEWMEFEVLSSRWDFERWKIDNLIFEVHLLNDEMDFQWDFLLHKIEFYFWKIKIINSSYCKEIFLFWAQK